MLRNSHHKIISFCMIVSMMAMSGWYISIAIAESDTTSTQKLNSKSVTPVGDRDRLQKINNIALKEKKIGHIEKPVPPPSQSRSLKEQERVPAKIWTLGSFSSIQVNVDAMGNNIVGDAANEPSIAVDPSNPSRMVIGWRQFDNVSSAFRQAGYAYSNDSGSTWTFPGSLDPGVFRSDPVLGADNDGNFYYYSLSSLISVEIFKSIDGGVNWTGPIPAFGGDKGWMAIDRTGLSSDGNIYLIWQSLISCCAGEFTRSFDGGQNFLTPFVLPNPRMRFGTMAVGSDRALYLAGTSTTSLSSFVFAKSTNIYRPPQIPVMDIDKIVDLGGATTFFTGPNPGGGLGQVWIDIDRSDGPLGGSIYILSSVEPLNGDPLDVMFIRSINGGESWSEPLRVNDDASGTNAWQWFGTMSVSPNGRIDTIWNDTRNDPTVTFSELYYSFSVDGGLTWSANQAISPAFNHSLGYPQQNKLGDYYHMVSDISGADLAYAATFNGEQDVYYLRIDADCNANGIIDDVEVLGGTSEDCNNNLIPDECEPNNDCNSNTVQDICDIAGATSEDCNRNTIPDECESQDDCNTNSSLDFCDIILGTSGDCNGNNIPDDCDIASGTSQDDNGTGVPDECEDACCICGVGCLEISFANCEFRSGVYQGVGSVCTELTCTVPNGECQFAEVLPGVEDQVVPYSNCSDTDGTNPVVCEAGIIAFGADVWYDYTTPCCGTLTASLCENTTYDAIIVIYGGDETCSCPIFSRTELSCGDDTCGSPGGAGTVSIPVSENACYTIRVGGWQGTTGQGELRVTMVCEPDDDADNVCNAIDNCPGIANASQDDSDQDGTGDLCDVCPLDADDDIDADGVCGDIDNCPTIANSDQADADLDGQGDLCDSNIDVLFVDADAIGTATGLDWDNAFTDIQHALELSSTLLNAVEVWVAEGTYKPSVENVSGDPRSVTFELTNSVKLYGGFAGTEFLRSQRDPSSHETILSGDIDNNDGVFPANNDNNAYQVVVMNTPGTFSIIDGFTITGGKCNGGQLFQQLGGGIAFRSSGTTGLAQNCVITQNDCIVGGGVGFGNDTNATVRDCLIVDNQALIGGALWSGQGSTSSLIHCQILNNTAVNSWGGGLQFVRNFIQVTGCVISGNTAGKDGGAAYADGASPVFTNCTIVGNTGRNGGGFYNGSFISIFTGRPRFDNCIMWDNTSLSGEPTTLQIESEPGAINTVNFSNIQGLPEDLGGVGNIETNPKFINADGLDDIPHTVDDNLRIKINSPCVESGVNDVVTEDTDIDGNPRLFDADDNGIAVVDMGAYESQEINLCLNTDSVDAEPVPTNKSRYISFVPQNAGEITAIRVKMVDLDRFAEFNGQTRWVGPPDDFPEGFEPETFFMASLLQCEPHFMDWSSVGLLHVYGAEVVPGSMYEVQVIHETCMDVLEDDSFYSLPLSIPTAKWGDIIAPFNSAQPNINDVLALVGKWLSKLEPTKVHAQLQPNIPNPGVSVKITDVLLGVNAWLSSLYPFDGPDLCP